MPSSKKSTVAASDFALDERAIEKAKQSLDDGVITPSLNLPKDKLIKLLNDSLATELVCVLRYRRHHFTVDGVTSPKIKEEFLVHANEEQAHADRIAERIVQLGGEPDFNPTSLLKRSHADYDDSSTLAAMVKSNLIAERVAIETYRQMITLIGDKDPTTKLMLTEILGDEEEHADELKDWMPKK
jgi:bacterioferritin